MSLILGIDPGINGAMALLDPEARRLVECIDIPTFEVKVGKSNKKQLDFPTLRRFFIAWRPRIGHAWIERITPMPSFNADSEDDSPRSMGATSAFNMGGVWWALRACVAMHGIPESLVMPAVWKRALQVPRPAAGEKVKDMSRQRASALLPDSAHYWPRKKDADRAEAGLIALFGSKQ